ncbi:hypothetical protein G5V59_17810 [Nocardioides sp. W3-2-3]|uniref:hypothetical protein n=1 Tax=Nocardioides convexus TaxID=2712224 RepID=UPI0024189026|nr:hypothetical protein [Nocardioides convexus]NHA01109.1 hypothetical protein [Nocardioides convexus]
MSAMADARRYGGQDAAQRVAERRARLLAAGLAVMGERGVAGATVRGVAEASGLAARYFYESLREHRGACRSRSSTRSRPRPRRAPSRRWAPLPATRSDGSGRCWPRWSTSTSTTRRRAGSRSSTR